jgi:hypothetical protein
MAAMDVNFPVRSGEVLPDYVQYYVMRQIGGDPSKVYFTRGPLSIALATDPAIELKVWLPCVICIDLDPAGGWQFQSGTPATLGSPGAATRYYNLALYNANMQLRFGADHCHTRGNIDTFSLYVIASGNVVKIDPDIKNPGDPDG